MNKILIPGTGWPLYSLISPLPPLLSLYSFGSLSYLISLLLSEVLLDYLGALNLAFLPSYFQFSSFPPILWFQSNFVFNMISFLILWFIQSFVWSSMNITVFVCFSSYSFAVSPRNWFFEAKKKIKVQG